MLLLYETAAGYALFQVDGDFSAKPESFEKLFDTEEHAQKNIHLKSFKRFKDTTDALDAASQLIESKLGKDLKKILKKNVDAGEVLGVADAKLGQVIKEKLEISCMHNNNVAAMMRGVRTYIDSLLVDNVPKSELHAMALGLAHSMSRYKLKFSPDKVDTMIIQAVSLLDDLDKELNNYVMRCREWYSWHFPELGKIVQDHAAFAKTVKAIGTRQNTKDTDLSDILPEELITRVKEEAEMSMGSEISIVDVANVRNLCDQIVTISDYRARLHEYLKERMNTLAPNLTALVGELVGARLIAHAGSLMNLAKYPASTIQILGAEKALFRALKTKRDTPKYGLIYHAQLISQSQQKMKGKVSRMLAAKAALAIRVDALREGDTLSDIGIESRAKLEQRIGEIGMGKSNRISGMKTPQAKYSFKSETIEYEDGMDTTMGTRKRKFEKVEVKEEVVKEEADVKPKKKKFKDEDDEQGADLNGTAEAEPTSEKKKKKKRKSEVKDEEEE